MSARLRVGVIGVGYLGRFHALIYSRLPEVQLVGVADVDAARAAEVAAEAGCAGYADPRALLGKVDAVSIVVPTSVHLDVARPYLEQGVHMLMEKPVAPDMAQGAEIVRLAQASGAILQIGHLERFNAGIMELARRIDAPRFIEAQRMGGFTERATDVDVVSDLMIHDIDIILSLVERPGRRACRGHAGAHRAPGHRQRQAGVRQRHGRQRGREPGLGQAHAAHPCVSAALLSVAGLCRADLGYRRAGSARGSARVPRSCASAWPCSR
jgi:predicted dehydrogenase